MNRLRDKEIATLYMSGHSLRRIAGCYYLSHERVRQILHEQGVTLRTSSGRGLAGERVTLRTPINRRV